MVDWRESGEVPDSEEDDDGFASSSEESQGRQITSVTNPPLPGEKQRKENTVLETTNEKDVWELPSSQEDELAQDSTDYFRYRKIPPSTPPQRSKTSDTIDNDSPLSLLSSSPVLSPAGVLDPPSRSSTSISQPKIPLDRELPRNLMASSPQPSQLQQCENDVQLSEQHVRHSPPIQSQILGHDAEREEARRAAVSYERSLRTRKPEQLRPYFTERTRFNNEWRQHGLRPVRVTTGDEERQRSKSPEESYEPESQDSALRPLENESLSFNLGEDMGTVLGDFESSSPTMPSPINHHGGPSSQMSQQTDETSLAWDELPSLQELASKAQTSSITKRNLKRKSSLTYSSKSKRSKQQVVQENRSMPKFIMPPSSPPRPFPPESHENRQSDLAPALAPDPYALSDDEGDHLPEPMAHQHTPSKSVPAPGYRPALEGGTSHHGTLLPDEDVISPDDSSENDDEDIIHQNSRKIKGVLPASWLRLDQQYGRGKVQKKVTGIQRHVSPGREHRRGLAQRRFVKTASKTDQFLFDDSDDDGSRPSAAETTDDLFHKQTTLAVEQVSESLDIHELSSDVDDGSAIEDNIIDRMMPSVKRQSKISESFGRAPKKPRNLASNSASAKAPRHPTIHAALSHSNSISQKRRSSGNVRKSRSHQRATQPVKTMKSSVRRRPVPQLSILDVIEADAPQFLKIAARTAQRRSDQGRGSPSKKTIQLATRSDHVDAFSVLNNWRGGSIAQRQSVSAAKRTRQPQPPSLPEPLREMSGNRVPQPKVNRIREAGPRKLARHVSASGRVSYRATGGQKSHSTAAQPSPGETNHGHKVKGRPGQLEIDDREASRLAFHSSKKILDRLYRNKYGDSSVMGSLFSEPHLESRRTDVDGGSFDNRDGVDEADTVSSPKLRKRRRKQQPRRLDLDQPQYCHAHDPLPAMRSPTTNVEAAQVHAEEGKLMGLGPYGSTYTRHFEIFPLDQGVYFHESTLLGSGALEAAVNWVIPERGHTRPSVSFKLEEKVLHWGSWNAQVSSEFGICLDYIAEQLNHLGTDNASSTLSVADSILNYATRHLAFNGEGDAMSFVTRLLVVMASFNERAKARIEVVTRSDDVLLGLLSRVYDRLLLVLLLALQLCRADPSAMSLQYQVEDLFKSAAKVTMSTLYQSGLEKLRAQYRELSRARVRERGLRDDTPYIQSWTLLVRVLDIGKIPRGSFWDMAHDVIVPSRITMSYDAQDFERVWEDLFTLLPLGEFNNAGVLVSGWRQEAAKDGWGIPLRLLRKVFDLYNQDSRQHPSFNNYCRAVIGRCHYLVEQWGWYRCSSVIGLIFDFFGSQNLAHLRNEEFYDSPQFLHDLPQRPSLSVSLEDRCFHIFLKLLALAIRKLARYGMLKDVRNLVARTVPNHSRQFLKEQTIHERDLAALRNHHDLLCTLFWATPPDLRPSVSLIERLVVPASSHKEACLINFRAWSQLARYIVSCGEATTTFKQFHFWRQEFFQQMMQQFNSVAQDVEQQFQGLSQDVSKSISPDMLSAMVSMNRAAIQDVLHFVITASLDVMKQAPDLEAAMFSLSTSQLQQVFKHFASNSPDLDWSALRGCLGILDVFLSYVDEFKANEDSQQSESRVLDSAQADDALLTLDHDVADSYFSMARAVLSGEDDKGLSISATVDKAACVEQVTVLSARLVARFATAGVMCLADVFGRKKYGLFQDMPHRLSLDKKKHLTLFITALLEHGFDTFKSSSSSFSLLDLWLMALVKPRHALAHENKLAEQLIRRGEKFIPEAAASLAITPTYRTNRDMFAFAISTMRKEIRDASPTLKKILTQEYAKTLRLVMEQIKTDLKTVVDGNALEHSRYVGFVREVVALIREHGGDMCQVDVFFYQISREYSPSAEDPQLLVAGMMSYGMGLSEGDVRAGHELFFFLYNNVKQALNGDRLHEEVRFLQQGMAGNRAVLQFVLGKLLPSVVSVVVAAVHADGGDGEIKMLSPLLNVYVEALRGILAGTIVPRQLAAADCRAILAALTAAHDGLATMGGRHGMLSDEKMHIAVQLYQIMNMLWPSVYMMTLNSDTSSPSWGDVNRLLRYCGSFNRMKESHLLESTELGVGTLDANIFLGIKRRDFQEPARNSSEDKRDEQYVASFTQSIAADVKRSWVVAETGRVSTQQTQPGQQTHRGTQATLTSSTQATAMLGVGGREWGEGEVVRVLYGCVREWNYWWRKVYGGDGGGAEGEDTSKMERMEAVVEALPYILL